MTTLPPSDSNNQQPPAGYPQHAAPSPQQKPGNGLAIAALILGIGAILFSFIPLVNFIAYIAGLLAIIFGIIALVKKAAKGMPVTGLILGVVAIILASIINAITAAAVVGIGNAADEASKSAEATHSVEYIVTVSKGTANASYGPLGSTSTADVTKDWTKKAEVKGSDAASLSVTGDYQTKGQKLTCEIKVDGKSVDKQEGDSMVSCTASTF